VDRDRAPHAADAPAGSGLGSIEQEGRIYGGVDARREDCLAWDSDEAGL
jgi:hypothetical protein